MVNNNTINSIGFGATRTVVPSKLDAAAAAPEPKDALISSADLAEAHKGVGLGTKIGLGVLGALTVAGAVGGIGLTQSANASPVIYQCQADPYQVQDEALLNHMATLFASPTTGYNHASGLYDADGGVFAQANEMTRLDGHQALKQLSCGHPVRLYSPQTGWLKFHNLNQLHRYVGTYGEPWDMPNVYLGSQYTAGYGSPYYDSQYYQYNDYNSYSNFYYGMNTPTWNYVAPPTYTPPSSWNQAPVDGNWNQQAPADNGGNWNQAPSGGGWNQTPSTQAPADGGSWNQAPPTQAPSWNQAPATQAPSWNQAPSTSAPSWNQAPATKAPSSNWNQAPASTPSSNWNQAPASGSGSNWNQAPASGSSWNQ